MTAKEYFKEEISGEPLTEEWVIYHLKEFTKMKCKEQKTICKTYIDEFEAEYGTYANIEKSPLPKL